MITDQQTTVVQVSSPLERQQVQYVVDFCALRQSITVEDASQLRLQLPSGEAVTTRNAVLREIAKKSKFAADLVGDQPLADALVCITDTSLLPSSDASGLNLRVKSRYGTGWRFATSSPWPLRQIC